MFKRASIEALFFIMKGKILISSPSLLSDSIFYKSIILIVDETDNSHIGFILNRPGGLFLMNDSDNSAVKKYTFQYGGPVSDDTFYIIKNQNYIDEEFRVMDGISWGKDVQLIINRIENRMFDLNDVIYFQGYSGWDINQLNEEISSDSWIVLDESDLNIFKLSGKKSWGEILKKLGNKYRIWWDSPDDIYLN